MLRDSVVRKYVDGPIDMIIGHSSSVYLTGMLRNIFWLIIAYGGYVIVNGIWENNPFVSQTFGLIGVFLLAKYFIDFLNLYLDSIVLSPRGIAIFRWEGLLEYKTEHFERNKIELISFEQKNLLDKMFRMGDIVISLDYNTSFTFENIAHPKKRVNAIMLAKHKHKGPDRFAESNPMGQQNFDILVETLGEVIQDYMGKKPAQKPSFDEPEINPLYEGDDEEKFGL